MASQTMAAAIVTFLVAATPALRAQAPKKGSGTLEITGPVRVIDGDTFELYIEGRQTAIGIIGIKAPRANSPCGRRAAEFMQALVNQLDERGAPVRLRFEEDLDYTFDARKRRMYYLKLPGGVSAAAALAGAGLAEPDGKGQESLNLSLVAASSTRCSG